MFHIKAHTMGGASGLEVLNSAPFGSAYRLREDAVDYLHDFIKQFGNAGFNAEHGYWWVRDGGTVTRYTIDAG